MPRCATLLAATLAAPTSLCFGLSAAEPQELEPVIVTGTRAPEATNRLPAALIVITREEIEHSGATHLVEVLRARAGVEVIDAFGDGSRTLVGLRGFGENAHSNTLILVDGRKLNNPDIGAPDLNAIALQDVERIEIVQGSAGALLGDQAVGGVINIITRAPEADRYTVDLAGGSYAQRNARATAAKRWDGGSLRLSGAHRATDNYRDHNELDHDRFVARVDLGDNFVELDASDERLQTPGALLEPELRADRRQSFADFRNDQARTETVAATAGLHRPLGERWTLHLDANHRETDGTFRLSFRGFPATSDATQDRRVTGISPRVTAALPLAGGSAAITAGLDAQRADYHLLSSIGPQSNDQTVLDAYLQAIVPLGAGFEATAAGRVARVENDLADNFIFPDGGEVNDSEDAAALGIAWRAAQGLRLFARADENFRCAKVDEYFASTFTPGIVILRTQTGRSLEAGADWHDEALRATLLGYQLDLDDELVFDPTQFLNANLEATRRRGALLEGALALGCVEIAASATYIDADVRSGGLEGKAMPLVARQVGRLAASWQPLTALRLRAEVQGTGARAFSGDFDNSLRKLPGYGVLNAGAEYRPGAWHVQLRVNNLLDREYTELGAETFLGEPSYFPSPELNGWLGAGVEF
ncbi:MAG TPA: TonB-dependent receptor [Verrucomicrobiae bacterium]|nr:TonB-dependent receptor [Verrucomicrobiae bacterium]